MSSRPSRGPLAAAVLAAVLFVSACSSGSATPTPSAVQPTATPETTPPVAPEASPTPFSLPSGPDAVAIEPFAGPFDSPTAIANAGDGTGRLFVVEQSGRVEVVGADGAVGAQPFLDITAKVQAGGERGLLGLAFHPRYDRTGRFFVNYTRQTDGATVVAEYRVGSERDVADPTSERILFAIPQPAANHNGGALAFGPDGYLYIAQGDGGGQNDQYGNGQNLATRLGKVLRIDINAPWPTGQQYSIPSDNPFANGGGAAEIWALGLRNPWRISFDREWGDLYIADVGGGRWEEIDRQAADAPGGLNYGWPIMEGRHCLADSCSVTGYVQPIAEYSHDLGCAVIGGYVYRGTAQPDLEGVYLFGDWCSGRIFTLQVDEGTVTPKTVLSSGLAVSAFGEDEAGEIYVADLAGGGVYHLVVP